MSLGVCSNSRLYTSHRQSGESQSVSQPKLGSNDITCKTRQPVAHEILFTPPRFSEWLPIELFWAAVKNEVASKWEAGRGMVKMREQLMAALDRWGDPSPIMGQELSFCGKLWRKVFGLVRSYDTAQRQVDDNSDEAIQAADEESESEDVDELSNIGDDEVDDSDQSDYASDRDS
jgi:hypothetical protein